MSRSLKFANMIAAELRDSTIEERPKKVCLVRGRLDIGPRYVSVEILLPWNFHLLKQTPPFVWCRESWIREGADWHNPKYGLCWVLPDEWKDVMGWKGKPVRAIMEEGKEWLLTNCRSLINRHYCAHLNDLEEWLPEWDAWGHGDDGPNEYARRQRTRRHPRT